MQNLSLFVVATLLLAATPGQDFIYVMVRSLSQGVQAGLIAISGLMVGVTMHAFAAATGIAALLLTSAVAFNVVKLAGAAYLVYIGIQSFRQKGKLEIRPGKDTISDRKLFRDGVFSAMLNPKLALFFMAFLPQFVAPGANPFTNMLKLDLLFQLLSLPILVSVAVVSGKFGDFLTGNSVFAKFVGRAAGAVLIALGLRLGMAER